MSYANGLSPFRGKIKGYLIPVSHFKGYTAAASSVAAEPQQQYEKNPVDDEKPIVEEVISAPVVVKPPTIKIENTHLNNGVSSLSISSIKVKKEAALKSSQKKTIINNTADAFSQEDLSEVWKTYINEKNLQGENNIAALLEMSQPELSDDFTIILKTSNSLSQLEIKKKLPALSAYLSERLNNFKIKFDIRVEVQKNQEYIYGVKEKYAHLKKINPEIEVLRKEFDLDI